MKWLPLLPPGALLLLLSVVALGRTVNARVYKIRSEAGVQKAYFLPLGGVEQYVRVRGQDRSNPVLVVLHGGPGGNMAYYSYAWQAALERRFTVVHWDQRGCGNTYYRDPGAEPPTLELLLSDLDELVQALCAEYGGEKVYLLGHSWGTFLGGVYALRHPERVAACCAVSQMVDFKESERASAREAARLARAAGKPRAAREIEEGLEAVLAFQALDRPEAVALLRFRQRKEAFLPAQYGGGMLPLRLFSPYMTWGDLKWMCSFGGLIRSNRALYRLLLSGEGSSLYDYPTRYRVPVVMVAGERDWTTPLATARAYFEALSAPQKEWITIQGAGHLPFVERPEEFTRALLRALGLDETTKREPERQ